VPVTVVGEHDARTVDQLRRCAAYGSVAGAALCADGHLGYAQPVGGVLAYTDHVSVSGVGYDIACGNLAVRTDLGLAELGPERLNTLADDIARNLSFGVGRVNAERVEHPLLDDGEAWRVAGAGDLRRLAAEQLGTVGSGNHYVDLFADERDRVWVGVHFGSRGLGHRTATKYLKLAGGKDGIDVPPTVLDAGSEIGRRYLAAMDLAGRYAYAGREWVVGKVLAMLGAGAAVETVHNHHNFAWRERHDGRDLWVVRKGATPAFPGQRGFVGGSMGDDAVILEGVDAPGAAPLFRSTVHGAGRVLARREAKRRLARAEMEAWLRRKGVVLRGGGWTRARWRTGGSTRCWRRTPAPCGCCTGCGRWWSSWPARARSTPTRTDPPRYTGKADAVRLGHAGGRHATARARASIPSDSPGPVHRWPRHAGAAGRGPPP
jgi:tRNA-splicing ligase RtcB